MPSFRGLYFSSSSFHTFFRHNVGVEGHNPIFRPPIWKPGVLLSHPLYLSTKTFCWVSSTHSLYGIWDYPSVWGRAGSGLTDRLGLTLWTTEAWGNGCHVCAPAAALALGPNACPHQRRCSSTAEYRNRSASSCPVTPRPCHPPWAGKELLYQYAIVWSWYEGRHHCSPHWTWTRGFKMKDSVTLVSGQQGGWARAPRPLATPELPWPWPRITNLPSKRRLGTISSNFQWFPQQPWICLFRSPRKCYSFFMLYLWGHALTQNCLVTFPTVNSNHLNNHFVFSFSTGSFRQIWVIFWW